eukprot:1053493-Pelagomonas_calceolata.AAC.4
MQARLELVHASWSAMAELLLAFLPLHSCLIHAWLEQYSRQLERLPSKGDLRDGLAAVTSLAKQVGAHGGCLDDPAGKDAAVLCGNVLRVYVCARALALKLRSNQVPGTRHVQRQKLL